MIHYYDYNAIWDCRCGDAGNFPMETWKDGNKCVCMALYIHTYIHTSIHIYIYDLGKWKDSWEILYMYIFIEACGAKHISKSKCSKHTRIGALFEVEMLKKCTPLSREEHFKSVKKLRLLDVQMPFRVAGARDCAPCHDW